MNLITKLFSSDGFMPHGHCFLWNPSLMRLHVISDSLITLAYLTIPVTLVYIARKRKDLPFDWMLACFGVFILACGTTHALDVWTLWHPTYWLLGTVKAITAVASVATAILLVRLIPRLLAIPNPALMREANDALRQEVAQRDRVEEELRRQQMELRVSEERFRGAFESFAVGMALVSPEGRWLRVNAALCEIVGRTEEELLVSTFQDITHPDDLEADLAHVRSLLAGEADHYQMEKRYFHKKGHIVWVLLAVTLLRDASNRPLNFVSQVKDITERHEAEQRMQASLEEKEVLLREIHHRVKNNLQVITSLLQLQSGYLRDPVDVGIFQDCQARIHAMALVHDRLYRSRNLATIDFSEHLKELTDLIIRGQSHAASRIQLRLECESVEVNLDIAIPLGLITAELITNAYKHAFVGRDSGTITVVLARSADGELCLAVADDGVGLPEGLELEKASSLGLRLIHALSRQLRTRLSFDSSSAGSTMRLAFPM